MSSIMREDWIDIEIGEVANIYNGNSINAQVKEAKYKNLTEGFNYIGTKDVGFDAVVDYDNGVKIPFEEKSFKIAPKGCVLVCSEGGSAGRKTAYIEQDVCFGNKLYAITDEYNVLEGKYVFYYSRYRKFFEDFKNQMNGIIGGVSTNKFAEILFPLAPLSFQRAIVSKTEELFSDLDNGIANFKKAQEQLKIYRQAVLKKAFEGKLSEPLINNDLSDDSDLEKEKSNQSFNQKNHSSDNLPKGWKWVKLGEVANVNTGSTPKRGNSIFWDNGNIPWITSGALNSVFVNKANEYISETALKETNCKIIPKGSLLIAMYGEGKTRGKCSELRIDATTNQAIASITFLKEYSASKNYIKWFFVKNYENIRLLSSGGVQPNLNLSIVKNTSIPFPPHEEQTQIVAEIERRLSVCDNLEFVIRNSIEKAEALRQSILKKAFEGRLLSEVEVEQCKQAADYEPASELLKRIKNEKLRITNERQTKKPRNS